MWSSWAHLWMSRWVQGGLLKYDCVGQGVQHRTQCIMFWETGCSCVSVRAAALGRCVTHTALQQLSTAQRGRQGAAASFFLHSCLGLCCAVLCCVSGRPVSAATLAFSPHPTFATTCAHLCTCLHAAAACRPLKPARSLHTRQRTVMLSSTTRWWSS
jgi:hypothetical protein